MSRKGCYGASLDPITNGHVFVIKTAALLFDDLIVSVAVNPDKKYMFTEDERVAMARDVVRDLGLPNVTVDVVRSSDFLANHAKKVGAKFLVRGVRSSADMEYESSVSNVNKLICPEIETIMLRCPPELSMISSSMVKSLCGPDGWKELVSHYVPKPVLEALERKCYGKC